MPRKMRSTGRGGKGRSSSHESKQADPQGQLGTRVAPSEPRTKPLSAAGRRQAQRADRLQTRSAHQRRVWWIVAAVLAAVVTIVLVLVFVTGGGGGSPGTVTPDDGRRHLRQGDVFTRYSTDPPTSGPHWERPVPGKRIAKEDPDERLVHNLEHGYIVMHHNCTVQECPVVVSGLKRIFGRYTTKIIVNYRPRTDAAIALAAWRRLEKMEEFDERRIVEFIEAYRGGGVAPEASAP